MAEVRVEKVAPADWARYRDVRLAMLLDAPRAFASTYAGTVRRTDEEWSAFVAGAHLWLAYAGGSPDPVGSIGMYAAPELPAGSAYLVGMWVAPAVRRLGVGTALVTAMLDAAREAGYTRVVLEVTDENGDASRLYRAMGFEPTGQRGSLPWDATITEAQLARDL